MGAGSKAREILNYSFLVALADDGLIDDGELSFIKSLALSDGALDEEEKIVLKRIFSLVDENKLSPVVKTEFQKFRAHHDL
jgi:tellurite resistance protein